jgi:hypothetical protein
LTVLRILVVCLLFSVLSAFAEGLQVWNTTEFIAFEKSRFRIEGFGIVRTRDYMTDPYDVRAGGTLRTRVTSRLSFSAGALRRWTDSGGRERERQNRFYGGPIFIAFEKPVRLECITQYERHNVPGADFNRYKQRFEVDIQRNGLSPLFFHEFTARHEGLVRSRSLLGFRWRSGSGARLDVGYQFESIKTGNAWAPRHSIRTTLALGHLFGRPSR